VTTTVKCALCGADRVPFQVFRSRALLTKPLPTAEPGAVGDMHVAYCPECRHVSSCFETEADVAALRERVYRDLYELYGPVSLSPTQQRWTDFVVGQLLDLLPPHARVLEIGSHDGYVLNQLAEHGHEVVGVEPSPHGARSREDYGLDVRNEFFGPGLFPAHSFDAVVVRHVAEHVEHPVEFLSEIADVLRPEGLFYLEVPDSHGSLTEAFFPEFHADHVSYFTPPSAQLALVRAGCSDLVHLESSQAYMRFPFLTAVARKAADTATPGPKSWYQDFAMASVLESFSARHTAYLEQLHSLSTRGRLAVWGTGSIGTQYAIDAGWDDSVTYVDINPIAQGLHLPVTGQVIQSPEVLAQEHFDVLLIASGWEADALRQSASWCGPDTAVVTFSDLLVRR
jgi:SAM-dependent methyltransferase